MLGIVLIVIAFLFIYLALIRPQRRRQVDQARMLQELEPGAEVVTAGGIYGTVTGYDGDDLLVEIAPELTVKVARRAIAGVVPPADEGEADEDADELEPAAEEPDELPTTSGNEGYPEGPR